MPTPFPEFDFWQESMTIIMDLSGYSDRIFKIDFRDLFARNSIFMSTVGFGCSQRQGSTARPQAEGFAHNELAYAL